MTFHSFKPLGLALLVLSAIACDQGREAPPDTTVRVVNLATSFGTLNFLREARAEPFGFKNGNSFTYDEDTYDFHVEDPTPTSTTPVRTESFAKHVLAGTLYTFVILENGTTTTTETVILESQPPSATATDAQVLALHGAFGFPAMDVYLEPPGSNILAATPWGSIGFRQSLPARSIAAGDYELTLTEAGNPANVVLASATVTLGAASSTAFLVAAEGGEGIAPLSVVAFGSVGAVLYDKNVLSEVRVINGAADGAPRDVAFNSQFSPPLFAGVALAAPTDYAAIPVAANTVNVTPAGNPGVLELTQTFSTVISRRYTLLFGGNAGALTHAQVVEDGRRLAKEAKLRMYNAASQFTAVEFLVVEPGTDITTIAPLVALAAPGASSGAVLKPGTYDLVLRQSGTTNVVAGPTSITLTAGGLFSVLATNGANATSANVLLFDDF
jgi:hypothetical protein